MHLVEAFEGSLPRPGGMVDGKFFWLCLLTNVRETNEFETKNSGKFCKQFLYLAWGNEAFQFCE